MMISRLMLIAALLVSLTACDRLNELANQAKLNGRAVGAACRHSGRALEDCFQRNSRIPKADIYAGWREMNEYMGKNKIEVVPPPPDKIPEKKSKVATVEIGGGTEEGSAKESTEGASPSADKPVEAAKPAA
ncbi:hypothetical protein, partial [Chitinimonas sp.]|uniref:hypothetical protein n=1 Tax=Chitinimonas sp. TaxID=1934313 RepID=UPI0035ADBC27